MPHCYLAAFFCKNYLWVSSKCSEKNPTCAMLKVLSEASWKHCDHVDLSLYCRKLPFSSLVYDPTLEHWWGTELNGGQLSIHWLAEKLSTPPLIKQDSGFLHPHSIWKDLHSSPFCFVQDFHLTFHYLRLLACEEEEWCRVSVFQNSVSEICGNNAMDLFRVRPILTEKMTINYSTCWMLVLKSIHKSKITFIHTPLFFSLSHVYCLTSNVQLPLFKKDLCNSM